VRAVVANPPDLIIMDVHMPVMNGLEATRHIRALGDDGAALPIIALTAEPLDHARAGNGDGVTDFIQKPIVDPDQLRAKVSYWLEHRHGETLAAMPRAISAH
jgi:CheY-like chemotaxis protein